MKIPYLRKEGERVELIVKDKPFYARAGEIHNSSASSLEYMKQKVWPALRFMHMNCVVVPVYWECVEPEEGVYDFTLVDGLIEQARQEEMHLVLLWFGLWKNSASTYVPGWVKRDGKRFWRVCAPDGSLGGSMMGMKMQIISPLCQEAVEADAKAYGRLMAHIREMDEDFSTVIAMQVENEIGILGLERDYSIVAQQMFAEAVPDALMHDIGLPSKEQQFVGQEFMELPMGEACSWQEVFGKDAAETFMAWYYGQAVQKIVESGKAEYPIPMYVNAWLEQYPWNPGSYPSGGPQFKMVDVWRIAAPSVDFYAPDIYVNYFKQVCEEYSSKGNPLFIPEVRQSADCVAFYFYAVGEHNALGFSPFGIEDMMGGGGNWMDAQLQTQLNISFDAMKTDANVGKCLSAAYEMVENMEELLQKLHREGKVHGFLESGEPGDTISMPYFDVKITYGAGGFGMMAPPRDPNRPMGGGMLLELSDWEFIVMGTNFSVSAAERENVGKKIEIERKEEGCYRKEQWQRGRILNGDERMMNASFGLMPQAMRFRLYEL